MQRRLRDGRVQRRIVGYDDQLGTRLSCGHVVATLDREYSKESKIQWRSCPHCTAKRLAYIASIRARLMRSKVTP